MSGIAKRRGISLGSLIRANPQIADPARIMPGDRLHIPESAAGPGAPSGVKRAGDECQRCEWVRMRFDGKHLKVLLLEKDSVLKNSGAGSGLPAGAPHLKELIAQGRTDLNVQTDYRTSKYQNVKDAGPIPEGTYSLPLTNDMAFQKTGGGWGVGGWLLKESFFGRVNDFFGGRSGFFLHHDGGSPGTAGCIGVKRGSDITQIRGLLQDAYANGQRKVDVVVDYGN